MSLFLGLTGAGAQTTCLQECSHAQIREWERVWDNSMGVKGLDPGDEDIAGGTLAFAPPAATDGVHSWPPVDGFKRTLCGRLHHRQHYCPAVVGDECDVNHYIVPVEPYCRIIREAITAFPESKEQILCCPWTGLPPGVPCPTRCLEAEVTPSRILNAEWWSLFGRSWHVGRDPQPICTYGPWVGDDGHSRRPEIHPAQLLWSRPQPTEPVALAILQDRSRRYAYPTQFIHKRSPKNWRPWAEGPVRGEFHVAFKTPADQAARLRIQEIQSTHVVASAGPRASDPCTRSTPDALEYLDGPTLVAAASGFQSSGIAPRFEQVCLKPRTPEQERLKQVPEVLGFLVLPTAVGGRDCDQEGYQVLTVEGAGLAPPRGIDKERWCVDDEPPPRAAAGTEAAQPAPEIRLAAVITKDVPKGVQRQAVPSTPNWTAMMAEAIGRWGVPPPDVHKLFPPLPVKRASEWRMEIMPHYEQSDDEEDIGRAVERRDRALLERLLGARGLKLQAKWEITATDLTHRGRKVPIHDQTDRSRPRRSPRPEELVVSLDSSADGPGAGRRPAKLTYPRLKVTFPKEPRDHLYEVYVTVWLDDGLAHRGSVAHYVWSHGIDAADRNQLLETALAAAQSVSRATLEEHALKPRRPGSEETLASRSRLLMIAAARLAEKPFVTLEEFGSLVFGAHSLTEEP